MCAIMDSNVLHESFGDGTRQTPAGLAFVDWLNREGRLVVGGALKRELLRTQAFAEWRETARVFGQVIELTDADVDARERELKARNACESNDAHVIAVAQLGGARLLFTNDRALQRDFKNRDLVRNPRGKVYSTAASKDFGARHRRLLARNVCVPRQRGRHGQTS